jgi:G3E family GTPase
MRAQEAEPPARARGERKPVSLITGSLGSGKTTLLRGILDDPALARAAVIVNEFGDTDFNEVTLARAAQDVVPANAGCFCCSGRAQLVSVLAELETNGAARGFDRVLIETSGLSDPAPLLQALINDAELLRRYRVDTVIAVVDAVTGVASLDERPESARQVALADRIVITKTDVADPQEVALVRQRLAALHPRAPVIEAVDGDVPARDLILSLTGQDWPDIHPIGAADSAPRHTHGVATWTIRTGRPATDAGLALWMDLMAAYRGGQVLRMKGIIDVAGEPVLVESVRHVFHPPVKLADWPGGERGTRVVVIAQGIERAALEKAFEALAFEPLRRPLDPQAYAKFRDVLRNLTGRD